MTTTSGHIESLIRDSGLPSWEVAFAEGWDFRALVRILETGNCPRDFAASVELSFGLPAGSLFKPAPLKPSRRPTRPDPLAARLTALASLYGKGHVEFAKACRVAPGTFRDMISGKRVLQESLDRIASFCGLHPDHLDQRQPFPFEKAIARFSESSPVNIRATLIAKAAAVDALLDETAKNLTKLRAEQAKIKTLLDQLP